MKKKSLIITIVGVFAFILIGFPSAVSLTDLIRTNNIDDDYQKLKDNPNYQSSYIVDGINLVKQDISCGYAVMEMFGDFAKKNINEEDLYNSNNNQIVTSSTSGFEAEMNKVFLNYETKAYTWLKSSDLIAKCYESLKNGIPVPFEMAYELNGSMTLHFSLLIGIDLVKDQFRILNPYGYDETMTAEEFINHTSYEIWKNKPLYLSWAFGLSIFDKNAIFISTKIK